MLLFGMKIMISQKLVIVQTETTEQFITGFVCYENYNQLAIDDYLL